MMSGSDQSILVEFLLDDAHFHEGLTRATELVVVLGEKLLEVTKRMVFEEGIDAASKYESALVRATAAMARFGDFSTEALGGLKEFSRGMEESAGITEAATLSSFAYAKSLGQSNDQAKETIKVAADMSAALGIDLDTAVKQLSATYEGNVGKLGKLNGTLKDFTPEALAAGDAVEQLGRQFAGAAAAQMDTYSGSVKRTGLEYEQFSKSLGEIITKSTAVRDVIKGVGEVFKLLQETVNENAGTIRTYIADALLYLVEGLENIGVAVKAVLLGFDIIKQADPFAALKDSAEEFGTQIDDDVSAVTRLANGLLVAREAALKIQLADLSVSDALVSMDENAKDALEIINKIEEIEAIRQNLANSNAPISAYAPGAQPGDSPQETTAAAAEAIATGITDPLSSKFGDAMDRIVQSVRDRLGFDVPNPTTPDPSPDNSDDAPDTGAPDTGPSWMANFSKVISGLDEPIKALTAGINIIAQNMNEVGEAGGPWVALIAKIVEIFTMSADKFKDFADKWINSLLTFMQNIKANMATLGKEIAKNMPSQGEAQAKDETTNPLPKVILNTLGAMLDIFIDDWHKSWEDFLTNTIPQVKRMMGWVADAGKTAGDRLASGGTDFKNAVMQAGGSVSQAFKDLVQYIKDSPAKFEAGVVHAGLAFNEGISKVADWITTNLPARLKDGLKTVIDAIKSLPGFNALGEFFSTLAKTLESAATKFRDTVSNAGTDLYNSMIDAGKAFIDQVSGTGGGGGNGLAYETYDKARSGFGLTGMPGGPGQNTGSFTPYLGKFMGSDGNGIPLDGRYGQFANGSIGGKGHGMTISPNDGGDNPDLLAAIAKLTAAVMQPMTVTAESKVDGRAFATTMLNLSRQNARTSR